MGGCVAGFEIGRELLQLAQPYTPTKHTGREPETPTGATPENSIFGLSMGSI